MKRIRLDPRDLQLAVHEAVAVVRSGGILVYPTDTVYGLGCDPFSQSALRSLTAIKQRSDSQQYVVLDRDAGTATQWFSKVPAHYAFFAEKLWPGPVTMIFSKKQSRGPLEGNDSIALRVPAFDFLQKLLSALEIPLVSTSANRKGSAPLGDPEEIWQEFQSDVGLFLDSGILPQSLPSTILDMRSDPPRLVRRGAKAEEAERVIRDWAKKQ